MRPIHGLLSDYRCRCWTVRGLLAPAAVNAVFRVVTQTGSSDFFVNSKESRKASRLLRLAKICVSSWEVRIRTSARRVIPSTSAIIEIDFSVPRL